MKVIGLTGGIGSGKSAVSNYLIQKGIPVADADLLAREAAAPGSTVLEALASAFGGSILEEDGSLNRKTAAKIIFSDPQKKEQFEAIIHPEITKRVGKQIEEWGKSGLYSMVFVDAALLLETKAGLAEIMDEIWVVDADETIRLERVMKRDGASKGEILARMANQMDPEEKKRRADVVIPNNGSEMELRQRIDSLLRER